MDRLGQLPQPQAVSDRNRQSADHFACVSRHDGRANNAIRTLSYMNADNPIGIAIEHRAIDTVQRLSG